MIVDIFLSLIGALFNIIGALLAALNFIIPDVISESMTYLISYLYYLQGLLPVQDIMAAIGTLASFYGVWYAAKGVLKLYSMLPFIGKNVSLK